MSGTERVLNKMPENVRIHVEWLKNQYKKEHKDIFRSASGSYMRGLQDAGLISDLERRLLFNYTTL